MVVRASRLVITATRNKEKLDNLRKADEHRITEVLERRRKSTSVHVIRFVEEYLESRNECITHDLTWPCSLPTCLHFPGCSMFCLVASLSMLICLLQVSLVPDR